MARIPEEEVEAVRRKADIVSVIGKYLQVQRKGKDYVCLCPFHDDHSPSMTISPDKQIYKCFVCGAGGNVFTFVQNYENVSFPEAVERVADMSGIPLSVHPAVEEKPQDPRIARLHKVLDETIRFTMYQMNTEQASAFRQYCDERGLNEEVRQKFSIGFNPPGDQLYRFLKAKGFSDEDMVAANVVNTGMSGIHDVFNNRITFPIHDKEGNPVGFSARTLDKDLSKYVNTNDTPLFHKSDIVYNAHRARMAARREGMIYMCEGVTDVIAFARAGMDNAVCTLGTSCTQNQISILKTLAAQLVICYDGDEPGQAATWRAAKMAMAQGCQVSIIRNDTGLDPDEIIRQRGEQALKELASNRISWMEFALNYLEHHTNMDSYLSRKDFVQKAQAEIDQLNDEFDRRHFTEELSKRSGFSLDYRPKTMGFSTQEQLLTSVKVPDGEREAEEQILAMIMASRQACQRFEEKLGYLNDPLNSQVSLLMIDAWRRKGTCEPAELMDACDSDEQRRLIARLSDSWPYHQPYRQNLLDGAIRKVLISEKERQLKAYGEQICGPLNDESRKVLIDQYTACLNELRRYLNEESNEQ
ncbi:MAG: DNA primase [Bulleidia sp.]|nr:DNA primase [Bulleidia sp.]